MKKILLILIMFTIGLIQAQINIPDTNLKNTLLNASPNFGHRNAKDLNGNWVTIDTNNDNEIQINEALLIGEITVYGKQIANLTGIEFFLNLTVLNCAANQIDDIDITQNINLIEFVCSSNQITNLNINLNTELEILRCGNNQISTLNTSFNTNLIALSCYSNQLSTLNVSQNINLERLGCSSNQINALILNQNTSLTELDCRINQLTELDLQQNENLIVLKSSLNQITNLSINHLSLLQVLEIENNEIETIDLSNNPELTLIYLDNNPNLTHINLKNGNNTNIWVDAGHNGISIYNCINLESVCVDDVNSSFVNDLMTYFNLSEDIFTEICTLLTTENEFLFYFSVYPTPTKNILNIKSKTEIVQIEIFSKLGQLILKSITKNKVNVSNLTQGLYFLKVKDINGNIGIKKIVKK